MCCFQMDAPVEAESDLGHHNETHISPENDEVNRIKTGHVLSELVESEKIYVNELLSIIKVRIIA